MRWNHDLDLLNRFYEESDELPESYEIEKQALQEQYEPRITVQIINGGLFYVTANHFYRNKAPSALEGALFRVILYPHYALVVLLCHAF